jgi:hypothetical protein
MSTKTPIIAEQAVSAPIESQHLQEERAQLLQAIVSMVRSDSQSEPQAYLEETKVPHGGE